MEDGTPDQALLFLLWPLIILGVIIAAVLFAIPRTRYLGWRLFAFVILSGGAVMLLMTIASKLFGPTRERKTMTTEHQPAP
jgi:hypothetical protein